MQTKRKPKSGPGKAAKNRAGLSVQQTIPYIAMHPDGVCQLPGGLYTKTVEYEDINYSVASTEDQTAIFGGWSSFLNYFDSSLPFQLSFINRRSRDRSRYKVNIPPAEDEYNSVREEFTGMLKNQIAKSNNGIFSLGLICRLMLWTVPISSVISSAAKYSACTGIST